MHKVSVFGRQQRNHHHKLDLSVCRNDYNIPLTFVSFPFSVYTCSNIANFDIPNHSIWLCCQTLFYAMCNYVAFLQRNRSKLMAVQPWNWTKCSHSHVNRCFRSSIIVTYQFYEKWKWWHAPPRWLQCSHKTTPPHDYECDWLCFCSDVCVMHKYDVNRLAKMIAHGITPGSGYTPAPTHTHGLFGFCERTSRPLFPWLPPAHSLPQWLNRKLDCGGAIGSVCFWSVSLWWQFSIFPICASSSLFSFALILI